jgi:hypothetical protein
MASTPDDPQGQPKYEQPFMRESDMPALYNKMFKEMAQGLHTLVKEFSQDVGHDPFIAGQVQALKKVALVCTNHGAMSKKAARREMFNQLGKVQDACKVEGLTNHTAYTLEKKISTLSQNAGQEPLPHRPLVL